MTRILFVLSCIVGCLLNSIAHADSAAVARELHSELKTVERETLPAQLSATIIQLRPEYRAKEQGIQRIFREILDSKQYEDIRVPFFSKAFDEQQLKDQLALARTPAFKLFQRKMPEMDQFSGGALNSLGQAKFAQLDNPSFKPDSPGTGSRMTFYSEDYGNFFISSFLYFEQETERIYRLNFSNKMQGSGYSFFLFCAARKFAATHGFDAWVISSSDPEDKQRGLIGFLKNGENVGTLLGERFAKDEPMQVENKDISELCAKGEEQANARKPQVPNPAVNMVGQLAPIDTLRAQEAVPEEFSSIAVEAPGSYDFVKECMPSISESSFSQMIRETGDKSAVTNRPADRLKPYLVVTMGRAFCVKMSPRKYPVLPLSVFDTTIDFPAMPRNEAKRLRTDLAQQLASNGFATAIVVNDAGNAYQVSYLLSSEMPLRFYYHANILKKGEFTESAFPTIYKTSGNMSVTSRGQSREHYKPFFARVGG